MTSAHSTLLSHAMEVALGRLLYKQSLIKHDRWMREMSNDSFYITGMNKGYDAAEAAVRQDISLVKELIG